MSDTRLFVYGTLRRGERAHNLLEKAQALGDARTAPSYQLVNLGPYPIMVAGGPTSVIGELYGVSRGLLRQLDSYEADDYHRRPITLEDGSTAEAYLGEPDLMHAGRPIPSGDWLAR